MIDAYEHICLQPGDNDHDDPTWSKYLNIITFATHCDIYHRRWWSYFIRCMGPFAMSLILVYGSHHLVPEYVGQMQTPLIGPGLSFSSVRLDGVSRIPLIIG